MLRKICRLGGLVLFLAWANASVTTVYTTNPVLSSQVESANKLLQPAFKSGWYAHKRDVTYIKLIKIGNNMGLSVLFSTTGLFCSIDRYLPFNKSPNKANSYVYAVGNGCIATINIDPSKNTFVMSVNSRSKCFEEYTYQEFCNGNLDIHYIDERASTYFIDKVFTYAKDQNDNDYDWNDD